MNAPLAGHVETVERRTTTSTMVTEEFEAEVSVVAKATVAEDVVTLTLRSLDDNPLPGWAAGAHVDLIINGVATRQYSLCGDPSDHHAYRLSTLR